MVDDDDAKDNGAEDNDDAQAGAADLRDEGKKALDAMKAQRTAARQERDAARADAEAAKAELAKLKGGDADKPTVDENAIREAARKEAKAEALVERVLDRIEAKAAKTFADPEDARAMLAAKAATFIDDGEIDGDAIAQALADLLKKKPHLGAQGAKRFEAGADGGARKGSNAPAQLTEQDLKRMTPEQIVEARAKGQLADLLG